ncbi:MAG: TIGR03667 family PPOX class F420-dependent oxidoreductase [Anaerolineales bacterium]
MIDFNSTLGRKAKQLLDSETIIWLTTVGKDLAPQPRPVWFVPVGEDLLIYSMPKASKVTQIRRHPQVALHFNCDQWGSDETVVVLTGNADLEAEKRPNNEVPAYLKKYKEGMAELGMSPGEFAARYSQAIRVNLTTLRGA